MALQSARGEKPLVSFNSGVWSDKTFGRFDLEKYNFACRKLENFTLTPYGGAVRRAGLEFINPVCDQSKKSRLAGYNFSTDISYILEVCDKKIRFYRDGKQIESAPGVPFEVTTPWLESELFQVQYRPINDVIYFVHPNHFPQKLIRFADDNWTLQPTPFDSQVFLDENLGPITLTPSATTGAITIAASASLFDADHLGAFWEIGHVREAEAITLNLEGDGISAEIFARGEANFLTTGRWDGTVQIRAEDPVTGVFETIREFTSVDASLNRDIIIGAEELGDGLTLRIEYVNGSTPTPSGSAPATAHLLVPSNVIFGVVEITTVTSDVLVSATVIKPLQDTTATTTWKEGAWSTFRGFPRAIAFFEQRKLYAGTKSNPQTIWGSKTADIENFKFGTLDNDALSFTLASREQNEIQWMVGQNRLIIGTTGAEWAMGGTSTEDSLTPTNVRAFSPSAYGSSRIPGILVNNLILFAQRIGRKIREFVEDDLAVNVKYNAPDLTLLSEQITEGDIVQSDYAQQPDSIYWTVTGDGRSPGMTYERDQDVIGWHDHNTQGKFESVATIYGKTGDEVWFVVKRDSGRFIERFNPNIPKLKEDLFFVDSGLTTTFPIKTSGALIIGERYRVIDGTGLDLTAVGVPTTPIPGKVFEVTVNGTPIYGSGSIRRVLHVFTGFDHLEGETIQLLGDGSVFPEQVVTGGSITLPRTTDEVSVLHGGLGFVSKLQPMNLDVDSSSGATPGSKKQIRKIIPRFRNTLGGSYTTNLLDSDGNLIENKIHFRDTSDPMNSSPPLFSGDKDEGIDQDFSSQPDITLIQRDPLPMEILAITLKHQVTDTS